MTTKDERLLYWLFRAHQAAAGAGERALKRRFGLGLSRLAALLVIAEAGAEGAALNHVAREMGVGASALTGLAERLVRDRLAARVADPTDGRAARLVLTPEGRALAQEAGAAFKTMGEALAEDLSAADRRVIARFLKDVAARADIVAARVLDAPEPRNAKEKAA